MAILPNQGARDMDDFQTDEPLSVNKGASVSAAEGEGVDIVEDTPIKTPEQMEDKVAFDERQQAKVNELIGGKVAKLHDERREKEQLRQQLEQLQQYVPQQQVPSVPEMPNPDDFYDDIEGYQRKVQERDKALTERAAFDAQLRYQENLRAQIAQKRQIEAQQKQQEQLTSYLEKGKALNLENEKIIQDGQMLSQSGLANDVQDFILQDEQGPLIASYLAGNVMELDKVLSMPPIQAAVYIANTVKPSLSRTRKTTTTPAPAGIVDNGGAPEKKSSYLDGVTFE